MYRGTRDPEIKLIVPQEKCSVYESKSGIALIEVFVPPETFEQYSTQAQFWASVMVKPNQVYFVPDTAYNAVFVNDGAGIVNSCKIIGSNGSRVVLYEETLTPDHIIGRYVKWFYHQNGWQQSIYDAPSMAYYRQFDQSGVKLERYIQQIPTA